MESLKLEKDRFRTAIQEKKHLSGKLNIKKYDNVFIINR
jgi:hypothetical protein